MPLGLPLFSEKPHTHIGLSPIARKAEEMRHNTRHDAVCIASLGQAR